MSVVEAKPPEPDSDDEWVIDSEPLVNLLTFGWMEDGRCGFPVEEGHSTCQLCPKPVPSLRHVAKDTKHKFVAYRAAAGSRHSLLIMIDCMSTKVKPRILIDKYGFEYEEEVERPPRKRRLLMCGLNQAALCEEKGQDVFQDVDWDCDLDAPETVAAGHGTSYFTTKSGKAVSYGYGKYGVLGHGDSETCQVPRIIRTLAKLIVTKISAGCGNHVVALTEDGELYSWGRNHKGQLGRGFESEYENKPGLVNFQGIAKFTVRDVSVGENHCIALIDTTNYAGISTGVLYAWGDESRGQLGSGDAANRMRPQENRWLSKYLRKHRLNIGKIAAGGNHNLVVTSMSGQIISWGAGDYGQLGNGSQWDEPYPKMLTGLKDVQEISAGQRHSLCVRFSHAIEVYGWGYNGYGELGLGDLNIRLQPTKVTAIKNTRVLNVHCGDRHSIILSSHKPLTAKEDLSLKPYFRILQNEQNNPLIVKRLKKNMKDVGMDPTLIDDPDAILPNQAGSNDLELKNELYDKGLRYCMDTVPNDDDWRRKALECCYEVKIRQLTLHSVCLACARNCLSAYRLKPKIKNRVASDKCDCRISGLCVCRWTLIRQFFDAISEDDKCIGPDQIRGLLKSIRAPYPVDNADVEDACISLCDGKDYGREPRVWPVPFEKWYRKYYDEQEMKDTDR